MSGTDESTHSASCAGVRLVDGVVDLPHDRHVGLWPKKMDNVSEHPMRKGLSAEVSDSNSMSQDGQEGTSSRSHLVPTLATLI